MLITLYHRIYLEDEFKKEVIKDQRWEKSLVESWSGVVNGF